MTTIIAILMSITCFVIAYCIYRKGEAKRLRVLKVLRESEERTRTILNTAVNGIVTIDEERIILSVNIAMEKIFGYREEELLGENVNILMPEPFHSEHDSCVLNYLTTGRTQVIGIGREVQGKRKDGSIFPLDLSVSESFVDGKRLFTGFLRDISVRKQSEEALRQSEERLHLATRAANIGIWDWDVQKNVLTWDDSMYCLYGIHKKDFGGVFDAWTRTLHPEDRNYVEAEIQAALRGEREYAPEFRIVHPDGTIRFIKAYSQTFFDENGKPLRMIGTNYDFSERKLAEEKLSNAYQLISADLEAAAAIQKNLLPLPSTIRGICFEWLFCPSSFVAGDIFNYFRINEDRFVFYLLDVSGHGVPAAMLSVSLSWTLSNMLQNEDDSNYNLSSHQMMSPSKVLAKLNAIFQENRTAGQYITMIYGVIDCEHNRVTISQAGLPAPIICNSSGTCAIVGSGGFPVGLIPDASYEEETIDFYPGDRLFLYSDGVTECFNSNSEQFSDERLAALITSGNEEQLDNLLRNLENELRLWIGEQQFNDDVTLLAIERQHK